MGNVVHSIYTTGSSALPDIYARTRGRVRIYQAEHECLWYKYNVYPAIILLYAVVMLCACMRVYHSSRLLVQAGKYYK